nr:hypothetical protein [Methylobacterium sp. C25]
MKDDVAALVANVGRKIPDVSARQIVSGNVCQSFDRLVTGMLVG